MFSKNNKSPSNYTPHNSIKLKPTLCKFQPSTWLSLPKYYQKTVKSLVKHIAEGKPYLCLGDIKVKCNSLLIRFRLGRNHRLFYFAEIVIMNFSYLPGKITKSTFIESINYLSDYQFMK